MGFARRLRLKTRGTSSPGTFTASQGGRFLFTGRDISCTAAGAGACKDDQATKKARACSVWRGNEYQNFAGDAYRCGACVHMEFWRVELPSPKIQQRARKDEPAPARRAQGLSLHGHIPAPGVPRARVTARARCHDRCARWNCGRGSAKEAGCTRTCAATTEELGRGLGELGA